MSRHLGNYTLHEVGGLSPCMSDEERLNTLVFLGFQKTVVFGGLELNALNGTSLTFFFWGGIQATASRRIEWSNRSLGGLFSER